MEQQWRPCRLGGGANSAPSTVGRSKVASQIHRYLGCLPQFINIRNMLFVSMSPTEYHTVWRREVISVEYIIEYFFCRLLRGALGSNATPPGSKKRWGPGIITKNTCQLHLWWCGKLAVGRSVPLKREN